MEASKPNAIGAAEMIERIEMLDKVALDSNILAVIEIGNITWKLVTLFGKERDQTLNELHKCQTLISEACDVVRVQDMMEKAYDISICDSLFLALAEKEQFPLLT